MKTCLKIGLTCALFLLGGWAVVRHSVTAATAQQALDFNRDIRPILSNNCFQCHGPDEATRQAKLRFDTKEGAFAKPGVIVPGKAAASRLLQRITTNDPLRLMPPPEAGHKLTPAQIETLKQWIEQGATWGTHWSFVAPQRPALPAVKRQDWPKNPIDYFVLARLEKAGLEPAPVADKATLMRRVTLDLTGLPPTPAELDEFLKDAAPNAYEKVVDRLLASPRYGERMAFRWLDAARYSDTHGYQRDGDRNMWRWRDWVIDAFNQNLPFDQFTIQQLAGDLLPNPTLEQRIATGFNRNHRANSEGGIVPAEYFVEYVVDRVDTTSTVFMGLTAGCARCHSHKFDPLTHQEYYQLYAYFNSVPETGMIGDFGNARPWLDAPDRAQQQQLTALDSAITQAETELAALAESLAPAQVLWEKSLTTPRQWWPSENLVLAHSLDEAATLEVHKPAPLPTPSLAERQTKARLEKLEKEAERKEVLTAKPTPTPTPTPKPSPTPTPFPLGFNGGAPQHVPAPTGQGAAFDGQRWLNAEQGVRFGETPRGKELKEKFAISLWFYPEATQSGALLTYLQDDSVTKEIKLPRGRGFGLFFLDGKVKFNVVAGWDEDSVKTETARTIAPQQWHHLLAVFDAANALEHVQLYLDGQKEPLKVLQSSLYNNYGNGANKLRIGAGGGTALRFKGQLDEVRIYRALPTAAQIAMLACADSLEQIAQRPPGQRTAAQQLKIRQAFLAQATQAEPSLQALAKLKAQLAALLAALPTVMVMQELPTPRPAHVLKRGAYDVPGEKVERGVPAVLPPLPKGAPNNRLGLAQWLVSAGHPLTARVQVNRYWQMLFGTGLVKTGEDFGAQSEPPSHPELLDWLAVAFRDGVADCGAPLADCPSPRISKPWDTKAMLKTMVMSATYCQSSKRAAQTTDPDNRLLSRGPRFRLPAEMLRDQALFVAGLLVEKRGGPSVKTYQPADVYKGLVFGSTKYELATGEALWRRSLYTYWKRTILSPNMLVLDASAREFCTVRETRTNTPLQALTLMNEVTFVEAARMLAERMLTEGGATAPARLEWLYRRVLARSPSATELPVLNATLTAQLAHYRKQPAAAAQLLAVGERRNSAQFAAPELAAYATLASLVLNLNETITRQ